MKIMKLMKQDFNLLNVHKTVWMSVLPHLICLIPLQVAGKFAQIFKDIFCRNIKL